MTRSVKDLRELICVSRLTMRESDEDEDDLCRPMTSLSIFGESPAAGESETEPFMPKKPPPKADGPGRLQKGAGARRKKSPAGLHSNNSSSSSSKSSNNNASVDLRRLKTPLPSLGSRPSSGESADSDRPASGGVSGQEAGAGNFDAVLQHIDRDVIVDWLSRSNDLVSDLSAWCGSDGGAVSNFVAFANFLLTELPEAQRLDLLRMEVGILHDELSLVFGEGLRKGRATLDDLARLVGAILREYPGRLCGPRGPHAFLDILDTLSSGRTDEYKRLLTDVKVSTRNRDHAQDLLAIRAFLLLSVWSNVVQFYRRFKCGIPGVESSSPDASRDEPRSAPPVQFSAADLNRRRAYQAVQKGFVSVLHYLVRSGKLDVAQMVEGDRSLVFEAVMHNRPQVLHYLVSKAAPSLDVNRPCDSGNTPLHAAANLGHQEVVRILLTKAQAEVNATNPSCDHATPLHLAVMQGHTAVCKLLLEAGANPVADMNGVTAAQLAEDLGQGDILVLLARSRTYDYEEAAEAGDSLDEAMEA